MKRYILKLALLAISMSAFVSCDEDTVTYGGQNFVSFDKVAKKRFNAFENVGIAEIPVNMAFPKSNDVTVTFKIENSQAVAGVDYVVLTPDAVTIPAGETSANIRIQITNNEILNDSKSLEITLTSISDSSVALGISDVASTFKRFLIVNDDCTTNFLPFVRQYNVLDENDVIIGSAEADVTENGDCNILRLSGVLENVFPRSTDEGNFIEVTLAPGPGGNKNSGTFSGVQQLYCTECYTDADGANNTLLLALSGTFINTTITNPTNGTLRLTVNSTVYTASSQAQLSSSSVRLVPVVQP